MFRILVDFITGSKAGLSVEGSLHLGDATAKFRAVVCPLIGKYEDVTVDFSRLKDIDTSGIGVLVECHSAMERRGGRLRFQHVTGHVKDLLLLVRLVTLIDEETTGLAA